MFSKQVLEQFENPAHAGELAQADATAKVENPACGDILELAVRVSGRRIANAKFRARGCVAAIACGAQLAEMITGLAVEETAALTREQLVTALGGLPETSTHAGHLAMDALQAVLQQLQNQPPAKP